MQAAKAKMQRIKLNSFVSKSVLRYLPAIILVKKEDREKWWKQERLQDLNN